MRSGEREQDAPRGSLPDSDQDSRVGRLAQIPEVSLRQPDPHPLIEVDRWPIGVQIGRISDWLHMALQVPNQNDQHDHLWRRTRAGLAPYPRSVQTLRHARQTPLGLFIISPG
jgi:hypothetical protein